METATTLYCPACGQRLQSAALYELHYRQAQSLPAPLAAPPQQDKPDVTVRNLYAGKNLQIVGVALFLISIPGCLDHDIGQIGTMISVTLGLVGIGLYVIGRFEHWYHAE